MTLPDGGCTSGDPVVRLWVDEPGEFEVVHAGSLALGDSVVVVEVRDGGVGVGGAVVVLEGGYGEYGVGVTGGDGVVGVRIRPRGVGWVRMYVSGDGYRVYVDSLEVVGGSGLYVSSVVVDDGVGWVGNGDGEVGWGERVGLGIGIRSGSGEVGGVVGRLGVVRGCSLGVVVEIDSVKSDSMVYVGSGCRHPGGIPFVLGVDSGVMGRCLGSMGHDLGCWLWLDVEGWHVRFIGDGGEHVYRCSLDVYGGLVGVSGSGLEVGDSMGVVGGRIWLVGGLGEGDYWDGMDIEVGVGDYVEVYGDSVDYGDVGSEEVVGWYEVGFDSVGVGSGVGVWFEMDMRDSLGSLWRDWVWLGVLDGELVCERVLYSGGGDSVGVYYGVRNVGGCGLVDVVGVLRGLEGLEVLDSVSWYGDIGVGEYGEGDGYLVRYTGDSVRYEVELCDGYGRCWLDTLEVRELGAVSGLEGEVGSDYVELSWESGDSLVESYDVIGMVV